MDTHLLSNLDLLKLHSAAIDELLKRKIVRSNNNPVGDYVEWLVSNRLKLTLATNSEKSCDAVDENDNGRRYQIKGRRVLENGSTQLSVIRNLESKGFDFLIAVILNKDWQVERAVKIGHEVVAEFANKREAVNGWVMHCPPSIIGKPSVEDITHLFSEDVPQYEPDDGPLTDEQYAEIERRAAPELARMRKIDPKIPRSVSSSLFGITD